MGILGGSHIFFLKDPIHRFAIANVYPRKAETRFIHALLRATLLLGDLHRQIPVREITIAGFLIQNHARRLYPRCKMVAQAAEEAASPISSETAGEDYLILYPVYPPLCFS